MSAHFFAFYLRSTDFSVTFVRPVQTAAPFTLPAGGSNYLQSRSNEDIGIYRSITSKSLE